MLAEKLGKTLGEVKRMPPEEYVAWDVYVRVREEEREAERGADG